MYINKNEVIGDQLNI